MRILGIESAAANWKWRKKTVDSSALAHTCAILLMCGEKKRQFSLVNDATGRMTPSNNNKNRNARQKCIREKMTVLHCTSRLRETMAAILEFYLIELHTFTSLKKCAPELTYEFQWLGAIEQNESESNVNKKWFKECKIVVEIVAMCFNYNHFLVSIKATVVEHIIWTGDGLTIPWRLNWLYIRLSDESSAQSKITMRSVFSIFVLLLFGSVQKKTM